jgi:hypothetical protein
VFNLNYVKILGGLIFITNKMKDNIRSTLRHGNISQRSNKTIRISETHQKFAETAAE